MMNLKTTARSRLAHGKKGFTLTEIAIVLGIIGLILGAIWVAASSVYANQKVSKAITAQLQIAQGIRALYGNSANTGSAAFTDITTNMCSAGVFPTDMVVACGTTAATVAISDPWINGVAGGTTVKILAEDISAAGADDGFAIAFPSVPTSACISLLSGLGQGGIFGGVAAPAASPVVATAALLALPATPVAASAAAVCGAAATNTVYVVYKLKG